MNKDQQKLATAARFDFRAEIPRDIRNDPHQNKCRRIRLNATWRRQRAAPRRAVLDRAKFVPNSAENTAK
jgi:hypothetical protein